MSWRTLRLLAGFAHDRWRGHGEPGVRPRANGLRPVPWSLRDRGGWRRPGGLRPPCRSEQGDERKAPPGHGLDVGAGARDGDPVPRASPHLVWMSGGGFRPRRPLRATLGRMPEPDPAVSSPPPAAPPPAPPTTGESARGPDPRDPGPPVPVSLGGHALGDLGHPRVDARLLQALLLRDGEVARWRDRADWTTRQLSPSSRGPGGRWSPAAPDGSQRLH